MDDGCLGCQHIHMQHPISGVKTTPELDDATIGGPVRPVINGVITPLNDFKWPCTWVAGIMNPINGVISLYL